MAAILLAACGAQPAEAPSAAALVAQSTAEPTPEPTEEPVTLTPTGQVLDYDEIRVMYDLDGPDTPEAVEYYTMRKGDNWGVMRADGLQIFPCEE